MIISHAEMNPVNSYGSYVKNIHVMDCSIFKNIVNSLINLSFQFNFMKLKVY